VSLVAQGVGVVVLDVADLGLRRLRALRSVEYTIAFVERVSLRHTSRTHPVDPIESIESKRRFASIFIGRRSLGDP
jgi:hypothetical protein